MTIVNSVTRELQCRRLHVVRVEPVLQVIRLYICIKALVLEYLLSKSDLGPISEIITVIN